MSTPVPIEHTILLIRGHRVLLDSHLAKPLWGVHKGLEPGC
jgi:hypothetical protein